MASALTKKETSRCIAEPWRRIPTDENWSSILSSPVGLWSVYSSYMLPEGTKVHENDKG